MAAGERIHIPIEWNYEVAVAAGDTRNVARSEVGVSENIAINVQLEHSEDVGIYEHLWVRIYLEDADGTPYPGDSIFGQASFISPSGHVFKGVLENVDWKTKETLPPGYFVASLHLEDIIGKIGVAGTVGEWTIQLYAQKVNPAPLGLTPLEAAQYVGGDFLLAPISLRQVAPPATPDDPKTTCDPDKRLKAHVH